ncbi:MAG: TonB-dependent receptor, partial [Bacteroidetes Order II. Incertae sedis bacterium]|nr:TonB-dependent receptor [Bacteroidetes Order II. bacterium]
MNNSNTYKKRIKATMLACSFLCAPFLTFAQDDDEEEVFELSPFTIDASTDSGYYASQTMAGGRLSSSLKDTGAAVQVITKEFMEDLGATGIEELLQYTTSSEVAGILGNISGSEEGGMGETNVGGARRDPDSATRVRGLTAPSRTRNFFVTDIPFDSYNTERIDIN